MIMKAIFAVINITLKRYNSPPENPVQREGKSCHINMKKIQWWSNGNISEISVCIFNIPGAI